MVYLIDSKQISVKHLESSFLFIIMTTLAINFRFLQLYTQIAHNQVFGPLFFQDHPFLGDLYDKFEGYYDAVVERMIGGGKTLNLFEINIAATDKLRAYSNIPISCNGDYFNNILGEVKLTLDEIAKVNSAESLGTQNLLAGIADELEVDVLYKIGQRLK